MGVVVVSTGPQRERPCETCVLDRRSVSPDASSVGVSTVSFSRRALTVTIYDLSGKQVRQLNQEGVVRGLFGDGPDAPAWDGLDDHESIVAPGIYLYRIALDADKGEEELTGTLSVAY